MENDINYIVSRCLWGKAADACCEDAKLCLGILDYWKGDLDLKKKKLMSYRILAINEIHFIIPDLFFSKVAEKIYENVKNNILSDIDIIRESINDTKEEFREMYEKKLKKQ